MFKHTTEKTAIFSTVVHFKAFPAQKDAPKVKDENIMVLLPPNTPILLADTVPLQFPKKVCTPVTNYFRNTTFLREEKF